MQSKTLLSAILACFFSIQLVAAYPIAAEVKIRKHVDSRGALPAPGRPEFPNRELPRDTHFEAGAEKRHSNVEEPGARSLWSETASPLLEW